MMIKTTWCEYQIFTLPRLTRSLGELSDQIWKPQAPVGQKEILNPSVRWQYN